MLGVIGIFVGVEALLVPPHFYQSEMVLMRGILENFKAHEAGIVMAVGDELFKELGSLVHIPAPQNVHMRDHGNLLPRILSLRRTGQAEQHQKAEDVPPSEFIPSFLADAQTVFIICAGGYGL